MEGFGLKRLADALGYSESYVAGVLSGKKGSLETQIRVRAVADLLSYEPRKQRGYGDPVIRFKRNVVSSVTSFYEGTACLEWIGYVNAKGYGKFKVGPKIVSTHRWAYEQVHGELPKEVYIDHLCRNRRCANVSHLEAVDPRTNAVRGMGPTAVNAAKTHCIHGHEFTDDNLIIRSDGGRRCRECKRRSERERVRRIRNVDPANYRV